jgi:hypothetical protein
MKMICTATCQYKGVTRSGTILDIPEAELTLDIVKHNFKPTEQQAPKPLTFGNKPNVQTTPPPVATIGNEKKTPDPDGGEAAGLTNGTLVPPSLFPPKDETPDPNVQTTPPPVAPVFQDMTVVEIKSWLDTKGVIYPDRANKAELVALAQAKLEATPKGE